MANRLFEYEENCKSMNKSGMRICYGKQNGGHKLIAHGEDICPLCEVILNNRGIKQHLKSILFMRDELFEGHISVEKYIEKTNEYEKWELPNN